MYGRLPTIEEQEEEELGGTLLKKKITCELCHVEYTLRIKSEDFALWQMGVHIQRAMPYLTDGERELLMTQTCDACWDAHIPDE
jgi:hypothetical protein